MKVKFSSGGTPVDPSTGGVGEGGTSGTDFIMVGSGCSAGWGTNHSAAGAIHLTETPADSGIYTWTGALTTGTGGGGQIKFHDGSQSWGSGTYTAVTPGTEYTIVKNNEYVYFIPTTGTYTVTLNTSTMKVKFAQ
jgi:hypothetical protein